MPFAFVRMKAVLESKWPTGSLATGFQLWMKLRNVVTAVAQFRTALGDQRVRRPSLYSSSDDPEYDDDDQSVDSMTDTCASESGSAGPVATSSHSIIVADNAPQQQTVGPSRSRVMWSTSGDSKENLQVDQLTVHDDTVAGSEYTSHSMVI